MGCLERVCDTYPDPLAEPWAGIFSLSAQRETRAAGSLGVGYVCPYAPHPSFFTCWIGHWSASKVPSVPERADGVMP